MQRRNFIKTVGIGSVGALGLGGATLFASSPVSATSNYEGDFELASDTGEIDHVSIYGDSYMQWEGLDTTATQVQIITRVRVFDGNDNRVANKVVNDTGKRALSEGEDFGSQNDEFSGEGTRGYVKHGVGLDENDNHDESTDWAIIQADDYEDPYGLPTDPVDADVMTVSNDGGKTTFTIEVVSDYRLFDEYGTDLTQEELGQNQIRAESEFTVDVRNIAASGSTGDQDKDNDGATGEASSQGETLN